MMARREGAWWPPSWLMVTIALAIGLVGVGTAVIWYEYADEQDDARRRCEQTVQARADARAMWVKLFEAFPDAAEEAGLVDDLEILIPPLECQDNVWRVVEPVG